MCSGDTNYLVANSALSQLNNSYQYSWAPSIGIAGASSNNDTLFINPSSTIIYTLTVKGTCVKRHTDEVTIAVNNCVTPIANYTVSSDTICTNKCVYYTDLTQNYTVRPLFYMWVFTGGSVVGPCPRCIIRNDTVLYTAADSLPIPNIHVCYHVNSQLNNNGVFPVEEDVWAGVPKGTNFSKATGSIKVDPAPLAHAEYQGGGINQNATINLGDVITLDATHSSGNFGVSSYTWSPSSTLSCTNCPNPVANPTTTTYYYLTVEDKSTGCVSTDSMTVYVDFQCFDPFIPTAFSPNGDGYNDVLYVRSNCLTNFTFRIYDRWGEKVFETSDISSGWDGSFRGQPMNAGVFVYTFDGYLTTNKEVKKHGNITLVK
jgi:gliding motility-associated-like protein